jgi:RNA polymerase sigma-70 factor (ECF subfamily)
MTADLISKARAGDDGAFREMTEPYLRELQVHCYRMLGSFADAEDALQDTLLAAWQGLGGFEGRASIRTWLYRIATNRCLSTLRSASRRPALAWNIPGVQPPEPTRLGEAVWLEPFPDALLAGAAGPPPGPEARYEQAESISLAFVSALQALPPRQLAVLILVTSSASTPARWPDCWIAASNRSIVRSNGPGPAWSADGSPPRASDRPLPAPRRRARSWPSSSAPTPRPM